MLSVLLGFDGNEFYVSEWPSLVDRPFGEVMYAFEAAVPVGIMRTVQVGSVKWGEGERGRNRKRKRKKTWGNERSSGTVLVRVASQWAS